jgi:PAS domain S-box-containing protein
MEAFMTMQYLRPIKILIVEDDKDDFALLSEMLSDFRRSGSTLRWASGYTEGLDAIKSEEFDICLLDYYLDSKNGLDFLDEVSSQGCLTPVILITGQDTLELDIEAMNTGAAEYLSKDQLNPAILERTIRHTITLRKKSEELLKTRMLSEQQKAELALRESDERYRLAMEATNDGIWDWNIKTNKVLRSPRFFSMLGYRASDFNGSFEEWQALLHPDDRAATLSCLRDYLTGRTATYESEFRMLHKSGRSVWVLSRGKVVARDENGNPLRMVGIHSDLTERKRAEEDLRLTLKKLDAALESMSDAVFISDADGRFVNFNEAFATFHKFRDKHECLKTLADYPNILDVFMPDGEPAPLGMWAVARALRGERGANAEHILRRKDTGETWYASYSFAPIRDKDGAIVGSVVVGRDITEHKLAEQEREALQAQLHQAQKMESVGRLAGGVAHDFNNMLNVIIGRAEIAMLRDIPTDVRDDLQEILKAGQRSAALTRQLLAFARKQIAVPKVLALNETISGMLKMLQRLIGEDISLAWMPDPKLWNIKMDPSQIDQILANLLVNARDAISGVGSITIMTENVTVDDGKSEEIPDFVPGDYVLLTVSDTGAGMSREVSEKIFEPFFTTKEHGKGTGLGLSTVYGIIKQNDGFVCAASQPGMGAAFKIYLPRFQTEAAPESSERVSGKRLNGVETVLLVEDDEAILNLSRVILERVGYTVFAADTPATALQLAEKHSEEISLLITDVVMPGMNGRELVERVRTLKPGLKCLFISGYTADVIAHRGVLDDGVNFIQKPFRIDDFAAKVRQVLDDSQ